MQQHQPNFPFPDEVLNYLFIGSQYQAIERNLLNSPIRYILNVKGGAYATQFPEFKKTIVPMCDFGSSKIVDIYPQCARAIKEAKNANSAIVVHCQGGMNRSATIVLAYLMAEEGWTLKKSWGHLKGVRPVVNPHGHYWPQLREFEKSIFGCVTLEHHEVGFIFSERNTQKFAENAEPRVEENL